MSFAGYYLTHLLFRGKLAAAGLYELDVEDLGTKSRSAIIWASITLSMYNLGRIARTLPPKVMMDCGLDFDRWYPKVRQMAGATALLATQRSDSSHYRETLDTLGKRFGVRVGRADPPRSLPSRQGSTPSLPSTASALRLTTTTAPASATACFAGAHRLSLIVAPSLRQSPGRATT
jgi:hypothetical protein